MQYNDLVMKNRIKDLSLENWMIPNPLSISLNHTVKEAALIMNQMGEEHIPVVGEKGNPVGIITPKLILEALVNEDHEELIIHYMAKDMFYIVRTDDSILDIFPLPFSYFLVVNENHSLVGLLTPNEILKGISIQFEGLNRAYDYAEIAKVILESAYEGIVVVDKNATIVEFNEAYSRFIGVNQKDVIGRPVQDVIDNTNLHHTVRTGLPERGEIQYIQGQPMVVHRIPIWRDGEPVGAIGMLIFEGVSELYQIYDRFRKNSQHKIPAETKTEPVENHVMKTTAIERIIGQSDVIANLKRTTRKVAKTDVSILITGESGTGKEMFARSIHDLSNYGKGPFISVNCGAIPEQLFESELFGYEEGAFTGAKKNGKPGKFELAEGGTIFLDEIGEMPQTMQTKLLRVLQEKEFERIGSVYKKTLKARIVAATNKDLRKMVNDGGFREDLYYRINVIELIIPPLRKRETDIALLISHYLTSLCKKYNIPKKEITGEAMGILMKYEWYGNIRELVNTIEKLLILTEEQTIDTFHLPNYIKNREIHNQNMNFPPLHKVKQEENLKEKELILRMLQETGGNKTKAAEKLGIHRTTLYQKLKKYRL
ncbi:sigma-54-dependent Fis family transcriptional regulator [Oceanobacillus sp. Castelsardo]|uniref:sigma-54-dependent Fis family transcriptional regulator n=1 Tax=Oceanobacillus sp. Castelsardo TaxID=1851204 RepID=UPI000AE0A103|nr:sigma-54-dependent Fis family transcriptional regulator [Oceanobacillus sp. Castelsardo]